MKIEINRKSSSEIYAIGKSRRAVDSSTNFIITIAVAIVCFLIIMFGGKLNAFANNYGSGNCGNNLTYTLTGDTYNNLTLTISGTGDMWDYYSGSSAGSTPPWHNDSYNIKNIVIESGVTSIGIGAFYYYGGYTSTITFPQTMQRIGDKAFYGSNIYGNLSIPEGVTYIGEYAFAECDNLNGYLSLPNSLTNMGKKAFSFSAYNCHMIGDLRLPDNLKNIPAFAFYGCSGFTSVTFGSGVTSIGDSAFYKCTGITSITLPESLSLIDQSAFYGSGLTGTLVLPTAVSQIKTSAFKQTNISLVQFMGNAPAENSDAFNSTVSVLYKKGAAGFTWPKWHGYNSEFERIKVTGVSVNPTNQTITDGDTLNIVASIEPANADIQDVNWTLNGEAVETNSTTFSKKFEGAGTYYIQVTTVDGGYSATSTIVVEEKPKKDETSEKSSGNDDDDDDDYYYDDEDNDTKTVTKTGNKLQYRNGVYKITKNPSGSKPGEVELVSVVKGKTKISVPATMKYNSKKYKVTKIGNGACKNNYTLKSISIGSNVTTIGESAFLNCIKLTSLKTPTSLVKIGKNACKNCIALSKLTISKNVSSIGQTAFDGCIKLKKIYVKTKKLKGLGANSFRNTAYNATYDVPNSKKKEYSKLFTKAGAGKKAKFK